MLGVQGLSHSDSNPIKITNDRINKPQVRIWLKSSGQSQQCSLSGGGVAPTPPPDPGAPYAPYGPPNQRLMSGQPAVVRHLAFNSLSHRGHRGLAVDTRACFNFCGSIGGLAIPYYFSIKTDATGDTCLCSASGDLVYGSGFQLKIFFT